MDGFYFVICIVKVKHPPFAGVLDSLVSSKYFDFSSHFYDEMCYLNLDTVNTTTCM
jgi:hypothetical protein